MSGRISENVTLAALGLAFIALQSSPFLGATGAGCHAHLAFSSPGGISVHMARISPPDADRLLVEILRRTVVDLVRDNGPNLKARQFAVFLICYLEEEPQTVSGLAEKLNVFKATITRVLDRLEDFGLARRKPHPSDRRSVQVARTRQGQVFLRELKQIMGRAAADAGAKSG